MEINVVSALQANSQNFHKNNVHESKGKKKKLLLGTRQSLLPPIENKSKFNPTQINDFSLQFDQMSKDSWNQLDFMSSTRMNKALKFYKKESPADLDHIDTFRTDEEGKQQDAADKGE